LNLRQRIEHRAGGFVELDRAANLERAVQRVFGAGQVAEADANLAERRQRDGETVARAVRFVQRHAALGERQRLLVAMLQHRHVGLVAADGREHIVGVHQRREALGLAERRHCLVVTAELCQ
jgi:hypothetical protein